MTNLTTPLAPISLLKRRMVIIPHIKITSWTVIVKGHEDKWFVKNNFPSLHTLKL